MTVLCYHAVHPSWSSPLAMEPDLFAQHCAWLARRRTVVPLHDGLGHLGRTGALPRGFAALTFDDGFSSVYEYALPVLVRHGLPSTVFLVAQTLSSSGRQVDWVDTPPDFELTTLEVDQIKEMRSARTSFESHSLSHIDLTRLSFADCVRDLRESRELLEELLGSRVRLLAYPRGRHNADVRAAAARAGYTHGFALPEVKQPWSRLSIPRVGIHRGNSVATLRVKAAGPYLSLRTGPVYRLAQRVRRTRAGSSWRT